MARVIGVIGVGAMGSGMVRTLAERYRIVVYDVDPEKVAAVAEAEPTVANSPREVGEASDVVLLSLPSNGAVETVAFGEDGVVEGLDGSDVLVDTSTVSPSVSLAVADACERRGVEFLDAPVSGGARNAKTGELSVMVGGPEAAFDSVRDVLETVGSRLFYVGEQGSGASMKLINNYLFALHQWTLCEALSMARAASIPDERFTEVVGESSGQSYVLDRNMERFVIPDDFTPEATVRIVSKDLRLAERYAETLGVPLLAGGGVTNLYRYAEQLGLGERDVAALVKLYEANGFDAE